VKKNRRNFNLLHFLIMTTQGLIPKLLK